MKPQLQDVVTRAVTSEELVTSWSSDGITIFSKAFNYSTFCSMRGMSELLHAPLSCLMVYCKAGLLYTRLAYLLFHS